MLPRRDSTIPNPGPASPRPLSGSFNGRRQLSLITNQRTFRAATSQTEETESPQSETSPQDASITPQMVAPPMTATPTTAPPTTAPPMPPRPPPFPPLPPRNSGFRRQTIRRDTHETYSSAQEFPSQSQSPNIMAMPSFPSRSPAHPLSPKHLQLRVSGEGVGGFAVPPSPRHGASRGYSNQYTADYNYKFDTLLSPRSDSGSPHYKPTDISGGVHADVWPTYNKISQELDEKKLTKWNSDLDVLLIFVSLVFGDGSPVRSD
jgi:hypothetical protein